ncbi:MAG: hypothetical protein V4561_03945 [Bacteroidota bacterium]
MILIAEPVHFGHTHVQVNAAFIALFKEVFPTETIEVVAEEGHIMAIKSKTGDKVKDVDFSSFKRYSFPGFFYWFQKIVGEWSEIIRIMLKARKLKPELLVWLCLFPSGHFLQKLLSGLFLSKQKQLVILHGELEYLEPKHKSASADMLGFILKKALNHYQSNTQYVVLGQSIKDCLQKLDLPFAHKVLVFQHPFIYQEGYTEIDFKRPLRICTFGALTTEKQAHLIYELAGRFQHEVESGLVSFETFGIVHSGMELFQNPLVRSFKPNEFIAQNELEEQLSCQHLALFFYDERMYQLSASGALHEALNLKLPFISFGNEYFLEINKGRKLGIITQSLDEMEDIIRKTLANPEPILNELQSSIIMFLQQNSFLLQAEKLQILLKRADLYISIND